ncbi:MAG: nuclear transport factor 2 family protein [Bacteroidales bacterium]|nr:nuclear transport factor 2 family protein [Bacteroidales bacterium]
MKPSIYYIIIFSLISNLSLYSQNKEDNEIISTINSVFDAMRNRDSSQINKLILPNAFLSSIYFEQNNTKIEISSTKDFALAVSNPHEKIWDERIYAYDIKVDRDFAFCWTDFVFFYGDTIHHCGTNNFVLVKKNDCWKIAQITDNSYTDYCVERIKSSDSIKAEINNLMNQWHRFAANSDKEFFELIAENGVYIGTDPEENWTKMEIENLYKPYFEQGKSWDFKAKERNIYVSADYERVWFDELLETWMGYCRASGYIEKQNDKWKICYYTISISVPNNKTKEVIEVIKREE